VKRAVQESWSTSNSTFKTKKVGNIELSFMEYSANKRAHFHPDIPIIGKQTLHDLGEVLDFKEKTIIIDEILLLMRNINNLQLKPSISRVLKQNICLAQKPVSMQQNRPSRHC
jgi:hypothetical protein